MNKKRITAVLCAAVLLISTLAPSLSAAAVNGQFLLYWPLPGYSGISAGFDDGRNHQAIDIPAPQGTPVRASAPGYVTSVFTGCTHNFGKSYNCCYSLGNHVKIQHTGSIGGQPYSTRYGHLTAVYVQPGQFVNAGDVIGTVGSTGYSTGNHLDYKFYIGNAVADPGPYLQVPSDVHYTGSSWSQNASYIQSLKSYYNTVYGGPVAAYVPGYGGLLTTITTTTGVVITAGQLYIENCTYPFLMKRGSKTAGVTGTIRSTMSNLTSVVLQIITPDNRAMGSVVRSPMAPSFDISTVSGELGFSSLRAGDYIFEVFAADSSGEVRLVSQTFTVTDGDDMIFVNGNIVGDSLKPGQDFTVRGEIIGVNPISSVTAAILNEDGRAVYSRTESPNANRYDVSALDPALRFSELADGVYTYKVSAVDAGGRAKVFANKKFYVSEKTLITGAVSIAGLGWAGLASSNLASPYAYATLRADVQVSPENAYYRYQWYADGVAIPGATGESYTVTSDKVGKRLSLSVTGAGNYFGSVTSEQTNAVLDKDSVITDVVGKITGKPAAYSVDLMDLTVSPALAGTPCGELLEKIIFSTELGAVYDKDDRAKQNTDDLCTGDSVKTLLFGQITLARYYVVVMGDVNGDGKVTSGDARIALRYAARLDTPAGAWFEKAADADHVGGVTSGDARRILRAAAKLEPMTVK
ncbi:MAG: peptidoglycan DD-metalloendopeptidase family protein [Clostridia bacterium]|nr:peptidoglycan DD-metalloendopeptidase family protein [Clostridia bacterium]